jgi:hypothetical protein
VTVRAIRLVTQTPPAPAASPFAPRTRAGTTGRSARAQVEAADGPVPGGDPRRSLADRDRERSARHAHRASGPARGQVDPRERRAAPSTTQTAPPPTARADGLGPAAIGAPTRTGPSVGGASSAPPHATAIRLAAMRRAPDARDGKVRILGLRP